MADNRRKFITKIAGASILPLLHPYAASLQKLQSYSETANGEDFWYQVKMAYTVSPALLNLNNGGVSPQPKVVQDAVERYNQLSNESPSYYMWRVLDQGREIIRTKLADLAGCSSEEIAINRNTTEALETIIFGLTLKAGDEIVLSRQDYPNMINAWKQRAQRDGIVLQWVDLELPSEDEDYLVGQYVKLFSERTRLVHITHMINWNGQVLPAAKIGEIAQQRGIEVLVDSAHTFAHLNYDVPSLNCDYLGTSLHKWLCAPFGSGMLYVRKDKIEKLYPLFAAPDPNVDNIRKFEHLGTRSFAIEEAIGQAIDFHHMIGSKRKYDRLHQLQNYWTSEISTVDRVRIQSPTGASFSGALGLVGIDGYNPQEIARKLQSDYKIHAVAIDWENIHGVRITPNVYTVMKDMDRFIEALATIASS